MIELYPAFALIAVLVVIWVEHRAVYRDWKSSNKYLHRLNISLHKDIFRLEDKMNGNGTYTYVDSHGNKYDDALEVTFRDNLLIIKRRSGSVAIPHNNKTGYTMTKNELKEEPESAKNS